MSIKIKAKLNEIDLISLYNKKRILSTLYLKGI
jgi:hypothetical protein